MIFGAACVSGAKPQHSEDRSSAGTIALVNVQLVDLSNTEAFFEGTVVVGGGRILASGRASEVLVPENARRIDAKKRYLLPGLADMHVHVDPRHPEWLGLFVASGVTTVLNMKGDSRHLELRERVARGEIIGPTIYTTGSLLQRPMIATPEDARRAVKREKD